MEFYGLDLDHMSLATYHKKRVFTATPEPKGTKAASRGALKFVVQKHAASHLHYDFRLEFGGTLKSWAVPKGPSMNPKQKRLAMHVEDHPLDYLTFEGTIPEGQYGAGKVVVWDIGTYHPENGKTRKEQEKYLREAYKKGSMSIILDGKKLRGAFSLVRTELAAGKKEAWLLMKKKDEP